MKFQGKALFNLLRIKWLEDPRGDIKAWQVEDLQLLRMEELFSRLKQIGIILNEQGFCLYAEKCESPEELADLIWYDEEDLEGHDKAYLLIFELWRRLLPEKMCLSVFCDALDQIMEMYDNDTLVEEESLQSALSILEDLLDETYDENKEDAQTIFSEVSSYCAHDIERFIFDYICDQIAEKNVTYASELLDAFYDYVTDRRRYDLLRAKLFALSDLEDANHIYRRILEELTEEPDLEMTLLIAENLVHHGDVRLFMQAAEMALEQLKTEEDFQNILRMMAEYFRCLDRETEESAIQNLLHLRQMHSPEKQLDPSDQIFKRVYQLIRKERLLKE